MEGRRNYACFRITDHERSALLAAGGNKTRLSTLAKPRGYSSDHQHDYSTKRSIALRAEKERSAPQHQSFLLTGSLWLLWRVFRLQWGCAVGSGVAAAAAAAFFAAAAAAAAMSC
eukprot:104514-Amphidinium_carterae.1